MSKEKFSCFVFLVAVMSNTSSMRLGDPRSSSYETSNSAMFQALSNEDTGAEYRESMEIDREYAIAMVKVGLDGVNQITKDVIRNVEQKASTVSKAKVYLNKAFQTYDRGDGMLTASQFKRALSNFGLQVNSNIIPNSNLLDFP